MHVEEYNGLFNKKKKSKIKRLGRKFYLKTKNPSQTYSKTKKSESILQIQQFAYVCSLKKPAKIQSPATWLNWLDLRNRRCTLTLFLLKSRMQKELSKIYSCYFQVSLKKKKVHTPPPKKSLSSNILIILITLIFSVTKLLWTWHILHVKCLDQFNKKVFQNQA